MGTNSAVTIIQFFVLCSVNGIRVPVDWNSGSAVTNDKVTQDSETISESYVPTSNDPVAIPVEYFQYPAKKPQFAIDVAKFHGVKNPEQHYSAYPIHPYTGRDKPVLGKHQLLDDANPVFHKFQQYTKLNVDDNQSLSPSSSQYETFHPYKAEEPALQEIYKDPVLDKIRNDIYNSQHRLQKYEKDAGKPDIQDSEYLESPEQTDQKKFPHKNIPVPYEIHKPQRRPNYYKPSPYTSRDRYLNHRFRHPWNHHNVKIRPLHYRPLKSHLQQLRQNHALKYDDELNEYPQLPKYEQISETPDGYDIYERGKEKYVALRNNVDESINNAVKQNHPAIYHRLELQNNGDRTQTQITDNDSEFVPIKNYAQVRKTETTKHLPKYAAFEDAASFEEIKNAPRLKEAVKSTKAQTVYTEEGYEDAAYDHEGEEKHAAENEAHGGYLTEKEVSGGSYKAPSISEKYQDAGGYEYRDQNLHGEQWTNDSKDKEKEAEEEDYSEDDTAQSIEADVYDEVSGGRGKRQNGSSDENQNKSDGKQTENDNKSTEDNSERKKRESKIEDLQKYDAENTVNTTNLNNQMNKHEVNFKVPNINLNSTYLSANDLKNKAKIVAQPKQGDIKQKYPYYFRNLKNIHQDSPLRYAENLRFIPKKSKGGTEFYDSRSKILECPEVDDDVDAIPDKLKKDGHPDESDSSEENNESKSGQTDFSQIKKTRRLKGLGDKIDCFKAKFFGENPLDSPFFKEEIISEPEPVTPPNSPIYKLSTNEPITLASGLNSIFNNSYLLKFPISDKSTLLERLQNENKQLQDSLVHSNQILRSLLLLPQNFTSASDLQLSQQSQIYSDVLKNINIDPRRPLYSNSNCTGSTDNVEKLTHPLTEKISNENVTYKSFNNKEHVTQDPISIRKKRAAPFIYEPYKIIKDGQSQESKKTTTTSNISPLIRKLQSSKIIDRVTKNSEDKDQPVKRNVATRSYKDIGKNDRIKIEEKGAKDESQVQFVDVSVDSRRGEPRYQIRLTNHKSQYAPVQNKKSMPLADYEAQTNKSLSSLNTKSVYLEKTTTIKPQAKLSQKNTQNRPTPRPFFDVSKFIPKTTITDMHRPSASNTVRKIIKTPVRTKNEKLETDVSDEIVEDYEEYDDDDLTTTTTSTPKPVFRKRRTTTTTTTSKPEEKEEPDLPKLRLITRFNTTPPPIENTVETTTEDLVKSHEEDSDSVSPKYREKKKKSSKSTLVTDTNTYGNGEDDMMKDEIDAMIGVQQDMDEYKPQYEKEMEEKKEQLPISSESSEEDDSSESSEEDDEENIEEEEDEDNYEDEQNSSTSSESDIETTTLKAPKQTLVKTTEAPVSTTETRSAKLEIKPIVHKKKIEIHKEIPVNKSSPHVTQYKQDFKEVEIIKEMPVKPRSFRVIPQKNLEALELYKDEKLAEEVNKLGAVEVFKENLDLNSGPKHGGNYRRAQHIDSQKTSISTKPLPRTRVSKDADTSQSMNEKLVEFAEMLPARRANTRILNTKLRNNQRSARLELDESSKVVHRNMHGGNSRSIQKTEKNRDNKKNEKFVELDDEDDNDESTEDSQDFRSKNSPRLNNRRLHGGNYKTAKLVNDENEHDSDSIKVKAAANNHRSKSAELLSSFAQAVPHLTTTPAYILDPSKRMYYYVDSKR